MGNSFKYYVVWAGHKRGIFDNWNDCRESVLNFTGAKYKAFNSIDEAKRAFEGSYNKFIGNRQKSNPLAANNTNPELNSISVDAAWNTKTKELEYQGVITATRELLFKMGPLPMGTNNIGEFLAIVHALALCKKNKDLRPVYTDSNTALAWVRNKKANTNLKFLPQNEKLFEYIERAETWLKNNSYTNKILKWDTESWGEIPADFGRK